MTATSTVSGHAAPGRILRSVLGALPGPRPGPYRHRDGARACPSLSGYFHVHVRNPRLCACLVASLDGTPGRERHVTADFPGASLTSGCLISTVSPGAAEKPYCQFGLTEGAAIPMGGYG